MNNSTRVQTLLSDEAKGLFASVTSGSIWIPMCLPSADRYPPSRKLNTSYKDHKSTWKRAPLLEEVWSRTHR